MRWIPGVVLSLFLFVPGGAWADIPPVPPEKEEPTPKPPPPPPADAEPVLTPRPIPADLGARMDEAVLLLSQKNFQGFVESFAPPEVLAKLVADGAMEEVGREATEHPEKIDAILKLLREARTQPANMNEEGTMALLWSEGYIERGEETIVFQKIDGVWYIAD